jgi:hypothetical protein
MVGLFPEDLNLVAVILPLVKTKPAQKRLTQVKLPLINISPNNDKRIFGFGDLEHILTEGVGYSHTDGLTRASKPPR